MAKRYQVPDSVATWKCYYCGTKNPSENNHCKKCQKRKGTK